MRKNMKKLTVATVIGAMTVTALAPVSAQAKDKTPWWQRPLRPHS